MLATKIAYTNLVIGLDLIQVFLFKVRDTDNGQQMLGGCVAQEKFVGAQYQNPREKIDEISEIKFCGI